MRGRTGGPSWKNARKIKTSAFGWFVYTLALGEGEKESNSSSKMAIFHLTCMNLKIPWGPLSQRQFQVGVMRSWVHTLVLKVNLASRAALGGRRYFRDGAGKETRHTSWELTRCDV